MKCIRRIMHHLIGAFVGIFIAFIAITFIVSEQELISVTDDPTEIVEVHRDKPFTYCRNVKYAKDATIKIDKLLVKYSKSGDMTIISFPSHSFNRVSGFNERICKTSLFPKYSEGGLWTLETYVSYTLFPFWTKSIKLKDVHLDVKD